MMGPPLVGGLVAAGVAVALHLYVFVAESVLFTRPATLAMFEVAPQHAPAVRLWAFHQGVYNLLVAAITATGMVGTAIAETWGPPLLLAGTATMLIAAVALVAADPRRQRLTGLIAQGAPSLIGLVLVGISLFLARP